MKKYTNQDNNRFNNTFIIKAWLFRLKGKQILQ